MFYVNSLLKKTNNEGNFLEKFGMKRKKAVYL